MYYSKTVEYLETHKRNKERVLEEIKELKEFWNNCPCGEHNRNCLERFIALDCDLHMYNDLIDFYEELFYIENGFYYDATNY